MKRPWRESEGVIPWLILIIFFLVIALLIKYNVFPQNISDNTKNLVDAATKIITTIVLMIGGLFSYIKFFKGRLLSPKININFNSGVIKINDKNLHWLEVQLENKGTVSVWDYTTNIYAIFDGDTALHIPLTDFVPHPLETLERERAIDINETVFEHAFLKVPLTVSAVTFKVEIKDKTDTLWWRSCTVSNL